MAVFCTSLLYVGNYNGNLKQTNCEILENRILDLSNDDTFYCGQFRTTIGNDDTFCGNMSNIWVRWDCTQFSNNVKELKREVYNELKIGKIYKNCYYDTVECDSIFLEETEHEVYFKILIIFGYIFITVTTLITIIAFCIRDIELRAKKREERTKQEKLTEEENKNRERMVELKILPVSSISVLPPPPPYNYV